MTSEPELDTNWHCLATKLAGNSNSPVRFTDNATGDELRGDYAAARGIAGGWCDWNGTATLSRPIDDVRNAGTNWQGGQALSGNVKSDA
jgi:hypothetical protein